MVASQRLIDERQRFSLSSEKEFIEVTADKPVESSKFGWGETLRIPGRNVIVLFVGQINRLKFWSERSRSAHLQCSSLCQAEAAQTLDWGFCHV